MNDKTKKFLAEVKRSAASSGGYVLSNPQTEISDSSNNGLSRDWQFRIAIDPEPSNIQKAAEVLAEIFHKNNRDLQFKVFIPPANPKNSESVWDGTQKSSGDTDRDQRGKEVCVYMRYDERTRKYEMTPEDWKELMLESWAKLQKAGVKMGYLMPPYGDRAVPASEGLSAPFSYTAFKPYNQRNGILFEKNFNPKLFSDPLEGIEFTPSDLKRHGIKFSAYQDQQRKLLSKQREHVANTEVRILNDLKKINIHSSELSDVLRLLDHRSQFSFNFQEYHGKDGNLSIIKGLEEKFNILAKLYPMESGASLNENPQISLMQRTLENLKLLIEQDKFGHQQRDDFVEKFKLFRKYFDENYEKSIEEILKDYRSNSPVMLFLEKNGLRNNLEQLVRTDPQKMQILFRQLIHLEREKQSFFNAEKQLGIQTAIPQVQPSAIDRSQLESLKRVDDMEDVKERFDPNFYSRWERTLMEDEVLHQLLVDNHFNRGVVHEQLNKREWLNRVASNLPPEMLSQLAKSTLYFTRIVFENPGATANLSADSIKDIYKLYCAQFSSGALSIERFALVEKTMLNNPHFAKTVLQDPEMLIGMSKQNFLHMLDAHKNNPIVCRELIANKDKFPERLSLKELQKDERFRDIVKASPNIPQNLGTSSVLQKIKIVDRIRQIKDIGYEPPKHT